MSFFKRAPHADDLDPDDDDPTIDPELRLRTVRTAHSTIAESIRTEARAERRKSLRQKRSRFFRNKSLEKKRPATADSAATSEAKPSTEIPGPRRNIYVNTPLTAMEVDSHGEPLTQYVRNKVRTSSESPPALRSEPVVIPRRIHHHHLPPKEPLRTVQTVRRLPLPPSSHPPRSSLSSVANLYFLVLVVLQGEPSPPRTLRQSPAAPSPSLTTIRPPCLSCDRPVRMTLRRDKISSQHVAIPSSVLHPSPTRLPHPHPHPHHSLTP